MSLRLACVGQALRCPLAQTVLHRCHAARFRYRRQLSVRSATTLKKHQVQAEEGPLNGYRLPSVKKQAAEHRQRVLSKLGSYGMLFVMVSITKCCKLTPASLTVTKNLSQCIYRATTAFHETAM